LPEGKRRALEFVVGVIREGSARRSRIERSPGAEPESRSNHPEVRQRRLDRRAFSWRARLDLSVRIDAVGGIASR
jgi:hypothetical protein